MTVKTMTTYVCDRCEKETDSFDVYKKWSEIMVPKPQTYDNSSILLCSDCVKDFNWFMSEKRQSKYAPYAMHYEE